VYASPSQVVKVAVYNNPPLCYVDSGNKAQGIYIDIINMAAEHNGWEVKFYPYEMAQAISDLKKGQIDLMPAVAYTLQRSTKLQFCQETIFSDWGMVYGSGKSDVKYISDLNGKSLGLEKGDIHSMAMLNILNEYGVKARIIWCSGANEILSKLRVNEIDAGVLSMVSGYYYNVDQKLKATAILFNPVNIRIAGDSLSAPLLHCIDCEITRLRSCDKKKFDALVNTWITNPQDKKKLKLSSTLIYVLSGLSVILILVLLVLRHLLRNKSQCIQQEKQVRLKSEKAVKQLEYEKTLILNSIDVQVVYRDRNFKIIWTNNMFKNASLATYNTIIKQKCEARCCVYDKNVDACAHQKCQKEHEIAPFEFMDEKTKQFYLVKTHLVYDHNKQHIGYVEIISDITQKKKSEKELMASKEKAERADYLKSVFLANMSHEIRTPMNAIIGFSELLEDDELTVDEKRKYLGIIQTNGQQLLKVISDILVFSQIESGHIEMQYSYFCVHDFLTNIYRQFKDDAKEQVKNLEVRFEGDSIYHDLVIASDSVRLRQVVVNLLTNALKFTDKGSVTLGAHVQNEQLVIYVRDTGIGIPQSRHQEIFKRFSQVENDKVKKAAGTGLGLTIARDLIKYLGGDIQLESEPGVGSTFYVTHPLNKTNNILSN